MVQFFSFLHHERIRKSIVILFADSNPIQDKYNYLLLILIS